MKPRPLLRAILLTTPLFSAACGGREAEKLNGPELTLLGNAELTVNINNQFNDPGASAFDDEDGDISHVIVVTGVVDTTTEGVFELAYDVTDSDGNAAETITRAVTVVAIGSPPSLTLLGDEEVTVELDQPYIDAGATASDPEDGDLTSSIITSGSVDTSSIGEYLLSYNVSDSDGNQAAPLSRRVTVFIPVNFEYDDSLMLGTVGLDEFSNLPDVGGATGTYSVTPNLPAGISLDPATGEISGTGSSATPRASYSVVGEGDGIVGTAVVEIEVLNPARFAYAANSSERTISIFRIDADSGRLLPSSYHFMSNELTGDNKGRPDHLQAHPSGDWLLATTNLDGLIAYAVNEDGSLTYTAGTSIGVGSPHPLVLSSDGEIAYVGGSGASPLRAFSFDPGDGSISQLGASVSTAPVDDIVLSHDGSRLITLEQNTSTLRSWSADESGALTLASEYFDLLGEVGELAISRDGSSLYLPLSGAGFDLIVRLAIDEDGAITLGENRPAPANVDQISLHPDGSAVYVASSATGETRRFPLDLDSGELGVLGDSELVALGELSDLRIGAAGRWMHSADVNSGEVGNINIDELTASLSLASNARARLGAADAPVIIRGDSQAVSVPLALYVSCGASNAVEAYSVDPLSGALSFLQTTPTQNEPRELVTGRANDRLYLANSGNNSISTYEVTPDNRLGVELGSLGVIASPSSLALEPSGRFLYSVVSIGKRVYGFEISEDDGTLRALQGEGGGVGVYASSLAADPTGRFLYCASKGEAPFDLSWEDGGNPGVVTVLYIDAETGVPVPINESIPGTVLVPFQPDFVGFDPSGVRAYTNQTTSGVKVVVPLDVAHSDGDGTIVVPGTATDDVPTAIEVGSSGRFAWVSTSDGLGGGELRLYDIREDGSLGDASAGNLTPRAIYTDVADPISIKSDANESFLYVLNKSSEVVSVWEISASDGTLTKRSEIMTNADPVSIHLNESL